MKTSMLEKATGFLRSKQILGLEEMTSQLEGLLFFSQTVQAFRRLYPKTYHRRLKGFPHPPVGLLSHKAPQVEDLVGFVSTAFSRYFQIDDDYMYMQLDEMNAGDPLYLAITPQGLCLSEEDIPGLLDGTSSFQDEDDLLIALRVLNSCETDTGTWEQLSQKLGLDVPAPPFLSKPFEERHNFDQELFEQLLGRHGLEEYELVLNFASNQTGNYLLDYNPYAESNGCYEPIEFTAVNLVNLVRCGREAHRLMKRIDRALERARHDPTILGKMTRIFSACMGDGECTMEENTGRQLTLAELSCSNKKQEVHENATQYT
jgi:hypothetical protein